MESILSDGPVDAATVGGRLPAPAASQRAHRARFRMVVSAADKSEISLLRNRSAARMLAAPGG